MAAISVIIVTYNAEETIKDCLESLNNQTFRDFEAILVDNASKDSTRAIVEAFKRTSAYALKTLYLPDNRGFCGGNNVALKEASGEFIALLNPDAKADAFWLEELASGMDDERVGICASKVLTWDGRRIDSAGDIMVSTFRGLKRGDGHDASEYDEPAYVFGACGAGAMYRLSLIEQIGFLDEDFFIQYDDIDLCFRAQLSGWRVFYQPAAKIYHKVSNSIGKKTEIGAYYAYRNMEFVRMKNVPLPVLAFYAPQAIAGLLMDLVYSGIMRGRCRTLLRAKIDSLRMAPAMLRKRRHIMRNVKKVDNAYIRSLITPAFAGNGRFLLKKLLDSLRPSRALKHG